jgi:hypothetical protein
VKHSFQLRALPFLAWLNVVLHVAGLAFAALGMAPGTPLVGLDERVSYLAGDPLGWSLGWGTWMLCTLALIAFFAVLARHLPEHRDAARLAIVLAAVGGGVDLLCDVVYIRVLPLIAARYSPSAELLFLSVERLAMAGGAIVANGLYSIGTLLLTLCLRRRQGLLPLTVGLGYAVFGFGMLLSAAGFFDETWYLAWATGPTIGSFCLWTLCVARSLGRSPRPQPLSPQGRGEGAGGPP